MRKNGFTLVELIAVIAILGIMGLLVSPAILKIRENSLRNSLDGKISMIKSASIEYASDHLNDLNKYPKTPTEEKCNLECIENYGTVVSAECGGYKCTIDFCKEISVFDDLIVQGYLSGDSADKMSLINPLNNESLNNNRVCITFDKYTADRNIAVYIVNQSSLYE